MYYARSPDGQLLNENCGFRASGSMSFYYERNRIMKNFCEFREEIKEKILNFLPESYAEADVRINEVTKNNDLVLHGLTVRRKGSSISPTIYLERFYDEYKDGASIELILQKIAEVQQESEFHSGIDLSFLSDFDLVKDKIVGRLINISLNANMLAQKMYYRVNDTFAMTFAIDLGEAENKGIMSCPITNELAERFGISADELYELALNNMSSTTIRPMYDIIADMLGDMDEPMADEVGMWVLTNSNKNFGAANILDTTALNNFVDANGNIACIPSSVHEWILVRADDNMDFECLAGMIDEVNETQVAVEEVLDCRPWFYSKETGLLRK